jgi:hypothetical protein
MASREVQRLFDRIKELAEGENFDNPRVEDEVCKNGGAA